MARGRRWVRREIRSLDPSKRPLNGFLFDQATRQNISYFNYGEAVAGNIPLPDKDRNAEDQAAVTGKFANSDIQPGVGTQCYANSGSIGVDTASAAWRIAIASSWGT